MGQEPAHEFLGRGAGTILPLNLVFRVEFVTKRRSRRIVRDDEMGWAMILEKAEEHDAHAARLVVGPTVRREPVICSHDEVRAIDYNQMPRHPIIRQRGLTSTADRRQGKQTRSIRSLIPFRLPIVFDPPTLLRCPRGHPRVRAGNLAPRKPKPKTRLACNREADRLRPSTPKIPPSSSMTKRSRRSGR